MKNQTSGTENGAESTVEKRARFERFSMTVLGGKGAGRVNVRNDSYGDDAGAHIYNVRVEGGEAVECNCPADQYQSGPCKHRVAVSDRPLVVSSASASANSRLATDGGTTDEYIDLGEYVNEHHERPGGCTCWGSGDCVALAAPTRPCKTCIDAGFTEPAPEQ